MKNVKSKSGNFGKAIGAILLALVFAVGGAVAGWYAHAQNWFGIGEKTDEQTKDEANGMVVSGIEANGLEVAVAPLAATSVEEGKVVTDEAYTLTVTPDPVDADDTYTWTATDTSSVTLSPSEDTKSCTVSCNQAFGTQITLTVTSDVTPDVTASATLDYLKAPTNVAITSPTTIAFSTSGTTYTVSATPTWGTGTITPDTFTITGGRIDCQLEGLTTKMGLGLGLDPPTGPYREAIEKDMHFDGTTITITTPDKAFISHTVVHNESGGGGELDPILPTGYIRPLALDPYPSEEKLLSAYNDSFMDAVTGSADGRLIIGYRCSYMGVEAIIGSAELDIGFDVSAMTVNAVTIDPNADGVIFY